MKKQENETPKKVEKVEQKNLFKSENLIMLQPKTVPIECYHLKDLSPKTLEDLIKVIGKNPTVKFENGLMQVSYGKKFPYLFAGCYICFDNQKNIIWIKPPSEVEQRFNILK